MSGHMSLWRAPVSADGLNMKMYASFCAIGQRSSDTTKNSATSNDKTHAPAHKILDLPTMELKLSSTVRFIQTPERVALGFQS